MWEKPRILVVDDEPMNVELLKAILPLQDYDVVSACDGLEALDILARQKMDLVLLDVMMPTMDGFEVTRKIRGDKETKGLPIILVTALSGTKERITGINAGCDEFLSKPFDQNEVLARIRTLLKLNYYRSQVDEKEKFEQVVNLMNDGLIICDADLNIVRTNQKGRELLGSEDLAPGWPDRISRAYKTGYKGDLRRDLAVHDLDFDLERPGTSPLGPLIVCFSSSVIKDTEGRTASIVIVLHDVTQQRTRHYQKENFLRLMSHKLRTPLALSMKHLERLRKSKLPGKDKALRKSVEIAVEKVSEFLKMTEKIFDFLAADASARFESPAGKPSVTMERVKAMVRSAAKQHRNKKVSCSFDLADGLTVAMDDHLFGIVFKNLVENSVKFNDQDVTKIKVTAARDRNKARFTVSDNGPGIPSEEKRVVFESFHQVDKRGTGKVAGLGLGLAGVKKIVEGNLGDICVDDTPDGGASISFTLPLAVASL